MKKYELIVFDWDGTLMDSESRIVTCMQFAARDIGIPVPDAREARDIIGLGMSEAVHKLFPEYARDRETQIIDAYRHHWLGDEIPESSLFDGARGVVERLAESGYLLAVATGKSRRGLDKTFNETGLGVFFPVSRCADEAHSKPHPQMLEEIITDLDAEAAHTLVIGDTEYDMQMAANAAVDAVGVSHGVHAPERLRDNGALKIFDDLPAFPQWLATLEA